MEAVQTQQQHLQQQQNPHRSPGTGARAKRAFEPPINVGGPRSSSRRKKSGNHGNKHAKVHPMAHARLSSEARRKMSVVGTPPPSGRSVTSPNRRAIYSPLSTDERTAGFKDDIPETDEPWNPNLRFEVSEVYNRSDLITDSVDNEVHLRDDLVVYLWHVSNTLQTDQLAPQTVSSYSHTLKSIRRHLKTSIKRARVFLDEQGKRQLVKLDSLIRYADQMLKAKPGKRDANNSRKYSKRPAYDRTLSAQDQALRYYLKIRCCSGRGYHMRESTKEDFDKLQANIGQAIKQGNFSKMVKQARRYIHRYQAIKNSLEDTGQKSSASLKEYLAQLKTNAEKYQKIVDGLSVADVSGTQERQSHEVKVVEMEQLSHQSMGANGGSFVQVDEVPDEVATTSGGDKTASDLRQLVSEMLPDFVPAFDQLVERSDRIEFPDIPPEEPKDYEDSPEKQRRSGSGVGAQTDSQTGVENTGTQQTSTTPDKVSGSPAIRKTGSAEEPASSKPANQSRRGSRLLERRLSKEEVVSLQGDRKGSLAKHLSAGGPLDNSVISSDEITLDPSVESSIKQLIFGLHEMLKLVPEGQVAEKVQALLSGLLTYAFKFKSLMQEFEPVLLGDDSAYSALSEGRVITKHLKFVAREGSSHDNVYVQHDNAADVLDIYNGRGGRRSRHRAYKEYTYKYRHIIQPHKRSDKQVDAWMNAVEHLIDTWTAEKNVVNLKYLINDLQRMTRYSVRESFLCFSRYSFEESLAHLRLLAYAGLEQLRHGRRMVWKHLSVQKHRHIKFGHRKFDASKLLGEGGFGRVHQATRTSAPTRPGSAKDSVLKNQTHEHIISRKLLALREFVMQSILGDHPNIAKVLDLVFGDNDYTVLRIELLPGNVQELVTEKTDGSCISDFAMYKLLRQFYDVIIWAHNKGVFFGDLKPDNIMYTKDLQLKVIDLGMTRFDWEIPREGKYGTPGFYDDDKPFKQNYQYQDSYAAAVTTLIFIGGFKRYMHNRINNESKLETLGIYGKARAFSMFVKETNVIFLENLRELVRSSGVTLFDPLLDVAEQILVHNKTLSELDLEPVCEQCEAYEAAIGHNDDGSEHL